MNQTPLMAAAAAGNVALAEALLARGADPDLTDHLGRSALHWAMLEAFRDPAFARGPFAALYELIAPGAIDVQCGGRLVRIDRHLSEYLLWQTLWALFKSRFNAAGWRERGAFEAAVILDAWKNLPSNVLPPERNRRQHLSHLLSRNEVDRDYAYNRRLFLRLGHGWYQFNPALSVRRGTGESACWVPLLDALHLPLVSEAATRGSWPNETRLGIWTKSAASRKNAVSRKSAASRPNAVPAKDVTKRRASPAANPCIRRRQRHRGERRRRDTSRSSACVARSPRTRRGGNARETSTIDDVPSHRHASPFGGLASYRDGQAPRHHSSPP